MALHHRGDESVAKPKTRLKDEIKPWWAVQGREDQAKRIWDTVEALEDAQAVSLDRYFKYNYLYTNDASCGIDWRMRQTPGIHEGYGRFTMNATQQVVDTAASIIAQNRAVPVVTTDGADWSMQRRAKQLTKFLAGTWSDQKVHVETVKQFIDACVFGTGFLKVYDAGDRVGIEHVPTYDLRWDELEGRNGTINTIHQLRWVDVWWLLAQSYVEKKDVPYIERAVRMAPQCEIGFGDQPNKGQLLVIESWRVGNDAYAGKHTISCDGYALFEEDWDLPRLPFVPYRWRRKPSGFAGQGLVHELSSLQFELNRMWRLISASQRMHAQATWLLPQGAKVNPNQINNRLGKHITFVGRDRPSLETFQSVDQEIYRHEERTYERMFEKAGISRSTAFGTRPPNSQSGLAIREAVDVENQRFSIQSQGLQDARVELAELTILTAQKIYGRRKVLKTTYKADSFPQTIDWKECDLSNHPYWVEIQAASILSRTPSGRKQDVIDFVNAGIFTVQDAKRLIDHPDVTREMDLMRSASDHADWTIDQLSRGIPAPVDPDMDLQFTIQRVMAERQMAVRGNADPAIIELMLRWEARAQWLLDTAAQMQAQQQMAMAAAAQPPQPGVPPAQGEALAQGLNVAGAPPIPGT